MWQSLKESFPLSEDFKKHLKEIEEGAIEFSIRLNTMIPDAEIAVLMKRLKNNKTLQKLRLEGDLSDESMGMLLELLQTNCTLRSVIINWERLGSNRSKYLKDNIKKLILDKQHTEIEQLSLSSEKTTLDLSNKSIGGDGYIKLLIKQLKDNQTLQTLNLENNPLETEDVEVLLEWLMGNLTLQILKLDNNKPKKYNHIYENEINRHLKRNRSFLTTIEQVKLNPNQCAIDLSGNDLGLVTYAIKLLIEQLNDHRKLQILNLKNNALTKNDFNILTEWLKDNRTLQILELEGNHVPSYYHTEITGYLQRNQSLAVVEQLKNNSDQLTLNLSKKSLGLAGIKLLSEVFKNNPMLQVLNLNANALGVDGGKSLAEALKNNQALRILDLGANGLCDRGLQSIVAILKDNHTLQVLDLSHNGLTDQSISALVKSLENKPDFQTLNLENNYIGYIGLCSLINFLRNNYSLRILSLTGNKVHKEQFQEIESYLKRNRIQILIKRFNLSDQTMLNLSQEELDKESVSAFAGWLKDNRTLQSLILAEGPLENEIWQEIEKYLQRNRNLAMIEQLQLEPGQNALDLINKNLELEHITTLVRWLNSNPQVQHLNLTNSPLDEASIKVLTKWLASNLKLQTLNMNNNKGGGYYDSDGDDDEFSNLGLPYKIECFLKRNQKIAMIEQLTLEPDQTGLDLSDEELGWPEHMNVLVEWLKKNPMVKTLDLKNNQIGAEGAKILAKWLKDNQTLQTLDLWNNNLGDTGVLEIKQCLIGNNSLKNLDVNHNNLSEKGESYRQEIKKHLEKNSKLTSDNEINNPGHVTVFRPTVSAVPYVPQKKEEVHENPIRIVKQPALPKSSLESVPEDVVLGIQVDEAKGLMPLTARDSQEKNNRLQTDFSLWAKNDSAASIDFLNNFPKDICEILMSFSATERSNLKNILDNLRKEHIDSAKAFNVIEIQTHAQQNAAGASMLSAIENNPKTRAYYRQLARTLDQSILAAKVISTSRVEIASSTPLNILNGVAAITGAFYAPISPFLNFISEALGFIEGIKTFREMFGVSKWVLVTSDISPLCINLAMMLTDAKSTSLTAGSMVQDPGMLARLKHLKAHCEALFRGLKAGEFLSPIEEIAILDAEKLLAFMFNNAPGENATQDEKIIQLIRGALIPDYQPALSSTNTMQQTGMSAAATTINTTTAQSHVITREEWEAVQKKAKEAEKKAEEVQQQLAILSKKATQSNPGSSHNVGNGPLINQSEETIINTSQGPTTLQAYTLFMESKMVKFENGLADIAINVAQIKEGQKDTVNGNYQANKI